MPSVVSPPFHTVPEGPETIIFRPASVVGLPWETSTAITVTGDVHVDLDASRQRARLAADATLEVALEVWCDTTLWSAVDVVPVEPGGQAVPCVVVPPGSTYGRLRYRALLVLTNPGSAPLSPRAATEPGSILTSGPIASEQLTGDGGQFPSEVVDFDQVGFPRDARWVLRMDHDDPSDPVLGTTCLLLNALAPGVGLLRQVNDESDARARQVLGRALRRYVVGRLVREALSDERYLAGEEWPEDSVGALVDGVTRRSMGGRSIEELRSLAESDPDRLELLVQAAVPDVL